MLTQEQLDMIKEIFDIYLAEATDDVDGSLSTMQYRNRRIGELEDALDEDGEDFHEIAAMLANYVAPQYGYCSGRPWNDDADIPRLEDKYEEDEDGRIWVNTNDGSWGVWPKE